MPDSEYVSLSKPDYEEWLGEDTEEIKGPILPEQYDTREYISGPFRVKDGTVPINILEFYHSYAYDCQKYFNLCVADPNTIIFASGNLIHFMNTRSGIMTFRRSSTGGGIGHITKNPSMNHIAVGENGNDPPIIIYEWPSMEIITILHQGTTRSYSHLAYSPDGLLLLAQGGEPDYMITIWNWRKSRILLRCKSHGQDIYNAAFSPTVPGHLTTSGAGHIKFWKMARTFTGLKLKGELGRFGKTEISDIIGVYTMPDEKVVSGCEWGNILLWDDDSIKLEVCKKNRKPCHNKFITQFEYQNGELLSVGMDGWIRVWYYETIDLADPPDEDRFLEVEPIYEFQIKEDDSKDWEESSKLMCIQKRDPEEPEKAFWYAQDGNGGLWLIDLSTLEEPKPSLKLLTCHAGPITCMDVATWDSFVATCGRDGHLHIYNHLTKRLILVHKFRDKGSRVVWFPCSVEATGSTIACAFESGIVRVITVAVSQANEVNDNRGDYVRLIQVLKPHTSAITAMSLNPSKSLLITGSEDSTIFLFFVQVTDTYPSLVPIGYIRLYSGVSCVAWKPDYPNTILVGCSKGDCAEVELPEKPQDYTTISYELVQCEPKFFKFQSVKSKIRRELARLENEKKKNAEREKKREKLEKLRADNPGMEIDDETFLLDDEEDPPLPEIFIPEVPNPILMANYTVNGSIWLSMGGYDAGYIYEYPSPESKDNVLMEPQRSTVVFDADDTEIRSCLFYADKKYLFLGMEHGEIRVCRVNQEDYTDFSNYWELPMHDNRNGLIPVMLLSHDQKMLLTCGHDGNLFSYAINAERPQKVQTEKVKRPYKLPIANVEDIEDSDHLSLEEVIVKSENDRIMAVAKRKKDTTLKLLRDLTEEYSKLMERNRSLLKSQQIPQEEFELDPRITEDLNNQLKAEMDLVYKKLAYKVEKSRLGLQKLMDHFIEPITCLPFAVSRILKPNTVVHSLRERKLGDEFAATYADVVRRIEEKEKASRAPEERIVERVEEEEEVSKVQGLETFLKGLSPVTIEYRLGVQINQILRKYRARKERMDQRAKEWKIMHASKPDPDVNHPDDVAAIKQAENTIGDYKLKVSPNFSKTQEKRETTLTKYKQLLDCRKKNHYLREDFNTRLRSVRDKKLSLQNEVLELIEKLKAIHAEIPEKKIKPLPDIPIIDYNVEYPEKNLELDRYISMAERVKETKRKKMSVTEEIIINPMDEEYEVLLLDEKLLHSELEMAINTLEATYPDKVQKAVIRVSPEILEALKASDQVETAWEKEMKRSRATRKIYEQDSIINRINNSYKELDKELDELERERLEITADSVYSDLFLLTLHQELIILKDFESMENLLTEKVNEKLIERDVASTKIEAMTTKIDRKNKEIVRMHEKIKELQTQFTNMISDNKFANFLRRIFKQKFKPPKENDDDESSSSDSESSESSSEDDGASLRSDELGPIHVDENICPIGCEKELYNSAFSMREKRYECEHRIKDEQKAIELLRKEVDGDTRKLKILEMELKVHRRDLEDFMREKQNKLNDIDVTVVLAFHQLQHFLDDNSVAKIRDCVVFDKTKLTRLYTRVGELQHETLEQKEKHKKNRTHLHRMQVDCKHMDAEIRRLKDKIKQEMMQKFGREVSLGALYEAVLRKMIYDMKADLKETMKGFDEQIKCVKDTYYEQLEVLEHLIQDNTEKLSFLTVLEGEQAKLKKILRRKPESEDAILKIEAEYQEDLMRLGSILKSQRHQKELFRNDIRNLRLKSRPLPPIRTDRKSISTMKNKSNEDIDPTIFDALNIDADETSTIGPRKTDSEGSEEFESIKESEVDKADTMSEELENEEEDTHTATMVHRLLSRVIESAIEDKEGEEATQEILRQVIESLPVGGSVADMRAGIERSVDNIIESLPQEDEETLEAMRQAVKESLTDIIARFEEESRNIEATGIGWNMKQKIDDLLDSMGINRDRKIENTLIKLLKTDNGIETAIDYLAKKVQTMPDVETLAALREHAFRTLTEIQEEMENEFQAVDEDRVANEEQFNESETM